MPSNEPGETVATDREHEIDSRHKGAMGKEVEQAGDDPIAAKIAHIGHHLAGLDPGPLAQLRRIDVEAPDFNAPYFWLLAARFDIRPCQEHRWARIIQIMVILTEKGRDDNKPSPHQRRAETNGWRGLGTALCDGADPSWPPRDERNPRPVYSETRLARLLASRGKTRADLIVRAARMLAAKKPQGAAIDCVDIAWLLLDEDNPEIIRRVARDYYTRLDRATRAAKDDDETTDNMGETQ